MRLGVALDIRTFKLPKGYDPNRHAKQLPAVLAKEYGAGWRVMSTDLEKMEVTAVREAALAEIADEDDQPATMSGSKQMAKMVTLPAGTKPSDGDKLAALYQAQHPGFFMVQFNPHLLQARLATMTDDEVIARGKLAAALKVKPWEVLLRSRPDGGFEAKLPKYTPSEHDSKLAEAAVLIGRVGWYVTVNPKNLVAQVIPAEPPTFPRSFPLDMSALLASNRDVTPLGRILPQPGQDVGQVLSLAWADMAFLLVGGLPNSGKFCTHDTRVPVPISDAYPTGWARHGDLAVGDQVFAVDGSVVDVDYISPEQVMPVFEVEFADGQVATVGGDHLWTVSDHQSRSVHAMIPERPLPIKLASLRLFAKSLCSTQKGITADGLARLAATPDVDLVSTVLTAAGVSSEETTAGLCYPADEAIEAWVAHEHSGADANTPLLRTMTTTEILGTIGRGWAVPVSASLDLPTVPFYLDPYVLGTRLDAPIPAEYTRTSTQQRVALLQGVMDVHGDVDMAGGYVLTLNDDGEIAASVLSFIRSLGILATSSAGGSHTWITFTTDLPVFTDPAKLGRAPTVSRRGPAWNAIINIRPAGSAPVKCIRVAHPRHLYLIEDFLPTHNTVLLNDIVSAQLAGGAELVIIDTVDKSADFQWAKPYVRQGGWGCESLAHAVAALSLVYEECQRRAEVLRARGIQKWLDLPENQQFAPILVVFDEVAALMTTEKIPAGIDKNLPEVQEMIQANMLRFKLFRLVSKIIAEMRFVGARMVLSTQITNQNTGLPPTLKGLIGHRVVMGLNASKAQRQQGFSDETAVPVVPGNVATDPQAGLGVGLAHLQATKPCVFKPFFATITDLTTALDSLDLPRTSWPEPSPSDVARFASIGGTDDADLDDAGEPLVLGGRPDVIRNDDGRALTGAAAAAAASKQLADAPVTPARPKCQDCGTPIQTDGSCRCA